MGRPVRGVGLRREKEEAVSKFTYVINGKPVVTTVRHYYFEWTVNGGCVRFGLHGPLSAWKDRLRSAKANGDKLALVTKRMIPCQEEPSMKFR
jgi:hypothetical protein